MTPASIVSTATDVTIAAMAITIANTSAHTIAS